jgi:hypothetical protein
MLLEQTCNKLLVAHPHLFRHQTRATSRLAVLYALFFRKLRRFVWYDGYLTNNTTQDVSVRSDGSDLWLGVTGPGYGTEVFLEAPNDAWFGLPPTRITTPVPGPLAVEAPIFLLPLPLQDDWRAGLREACETGLSFYAGPAREADTFPLEARLNPVEQLGYFAAVSRQLQETLAKIKL